jgi:hypothetical protein
MLARRLIDEGTLESAHFLGKSAPCASGIRRFTR